MVDGQCNAIDKGFVKQKYMGNNNHLSLHACLLDLVLEERQDIAPLFPFV